MATPGKLSYQVFVSEPIPFNVTERAPNGDHRMFQPISSTLIVGATDAVLVWDKYFPDQIPDTPVLATTPPGNRFELEGNELRIVEVGHSDTDQTSVLYVPSIGLIVAGDVIYNGYHQYLAETRNGGLKAWMKAVDLVAALKPRFIVAGHKNKALEDDPRIIAETRHYLEDAERLIGTSHTALEFYNAMIELYPDRLNPSALWFWGAKTLFENAKEKRAS